MRAFTLLPFVALITSALAVSLPARDECVEVGAEICGGDQLIATRTIQVAKRAPETNAERFARGLPPAPPMIKRGNRHGHHGPSRTRTCSPSPLPPVTFRGVLQVLSDDTPLGYVADDPNYWTPLLTPDVASALVVSFSLPHGATSGSTLDLALQGFPYPLFGVTTGRDSTSPDFAPGSFNYGYVSQTTHTDPNATPQLVSSKFRDATGLDKPSESAIWSVDTVTGATTVQWVNSDGSKPTTILFVQSNHLYVGGDPAQFQSRFPAPVTTVTLKFIAV